MRKSPILISSNDLEFPEVPANVIKLSAKKMMLAKWFQQLLKPRSVRSATLRECPGVYAQHHSREFSETFRHESKSKTIFLLNLGVQCAQVLGGKEDRTRGSQAECPLPLPPTWRHSKTNKWHTRPRCVPPALRYPDGTGSVGLNAGSPKMPATSTAPDACHQHSAPRNLT